MSPTTTGIDRNLTHYADRDFSRYLRRAFLASAGYDEADLERPVVGIAHTSVRLHYEMAAHRHDLEGPRAVSFRTAFVVRPLEWGPEG